MQDYLIWAIIIYFPIALLMAWVLRNSGLQIKSIGGIVLISLFVVVMFPISMARLGTGLSALIYLVILAAIVYYLLGNNQLGIEETGGEISTESGRYNDNKHILEPEMPLCAGVSAQAEDKSGVLKTVPLTSLEPLSNAEENADNESLTVTGKKSEGIEEQTLTDDTLLGEEKNIITINFTAEIADNQQKLYDNDNYLTKTSADLPEDFKEDNDKSVNSSNEKSKEISSGNNSDFNLDNDYDTEENYQSANEGETRLDLLAAETEEHTPEIDTAFTSELAATLDRGFVYKEEGQLQAALIEFNRVWQETDDYELGFLLTMELFDLYTTVGNYAEAEKVLSSFASKAVNFPAIMNEIETKIKWVRTLKAELAHLGIAELPYAELPRLVKMKVAEISGIEQY